MSEVRSRLYKAVKRSLLLYGLVVVDIAVAEPLVLSCVPTSVPIEVDGNFGADEWAAALPVSIADAVAPIQHELRCLHDHHSIYIAATFPDPTENRLHKSRNWDFEQRRFRISTRREDTLVLKWNMDAQDGDISLHSDTPHKADIWYWKANRTDPQGYADDRYHLYTNEPTSKARKLISESGYRFYLSRQADRGNAPYEPRIGGVYVGADEVEGYDLQTPSDSRADIRAKGRWSDGRWRIEFSRALQTGNSDDVQLQLDKRYQLARKSHHRY